MANALITYRYFLFGLFLLCQAIICSVATWNLSLAQEAGFNPRIDVYLIFLGAIGVFFILPVIFIDLARRNAVTSRVWFECLWVSVFWLMELAGAAALTATVPKMLCSANSEIIVLDLCTSTKVLLAFTWIVTIALLVYVVALPISAILHQDDDQHVWQSSVRFFPWYTTKSALGSAPPSPRSWQKRSFVLAAPKPKRPAVLRTDILDVEKAAIPGYASPAAPPPMQQSLREAVTVPQQQQPPAPPSLYPAAVQAKLAYQARQPPREEPTPPPLGEWPRSMKGFKTRQHVPAPINVERKPVAAPSRTALPPSAHVPMSARKPVPASARAAYHAEPSPSTRAHPQAAPPRTEVSRRGAGSPSRKAAPAPLNLSGISAYQAIDARRGH